VSCARGGAAKKVGERDVRDVVTTINITVVDFLVKWPCHWSLLEVLLKRVQIWVSVDPGQGFLAALKGEGVCTLEIFCSAPKSVKGRRDESGRLEHACS
jgi:hypothetical protein